MKLGLKARRYVSDAVKAFGSVNDRVDWEEWVRYSAGNELRGSARDIVLRAIRAKSADLNARIERESEENEDAIADMGNERAYLESLIRTLSERVPA